MGMPREDDIAIVGAAVRLPGAPDLEAYWRLLKSGGEAMRALPPGLPANPLHHDLARRPNYVPVVAPIDEADRFDAGFFGYTPMEALVLDPQQRHLLECAWLAFEHAGIVPGDGPSQRTAVYASVSFSTYLTAHLLPLVNGGELDLTELGLGNDKDFAAARIAYKLGLTGPAIGVQTACSSSLVAVHLACRALIEGESDLALVAAASITFPDDVGYLHTPSDIRSRDGRCRPFAEDASGTIFGSGAGAVLLRRAEDAIAQGDRVMALIRGSAINNDGSGRVGFTAPNGDGQSAVIAEALAVADVEPRAIGYVEAHGTATEMGDPIELAALADAFSIMGPLAPGGIPLGAAKANIGHLDKAAGLAGLVKAALALERQEIPPTPHAERPNRALGLDTSPFRLLPRAEPWPRAERPRLASVSSFGMGGTNAHAVLEEAPPAPATAPGRPVELILISGRDAQDAEAVAARLADGVDPASDLGDLAHTLRVGRKALPERRMLIAGDPPQALAMLREGRYFRRRANASASAAFVVPGQGSQYPGMARTLIASEPGFAGHFHRLAGLVQGAGGPDLVAILEETDEAAVSATGIAQPLLFATATALGRTLEALGVRPDAMAGHSVGEIAVACLGGALSEADASRLVVARAQAMAQAPRGAMAQLSTDRERAEELARAIAAESGEIIAITVLNAPGAVIAGGTFAAIDRLIASAAGLGIPSTRLRTSHAFHTAMMADAARRVEQVAATLDPRAHDGRIVSTLTGEWLAPDGFADPAYWGRQVREPVRFEQALARLLEGAPDLLVELGPPGGLAAFAPATAAAHGLACPPVVSLLPGARQAAEAGAGLGALLGGLGQLWLAGKTPDWRRLDEPILPRRRLALPPYPFKRERHWTDAGPTAPAEAAVPAAGPSFPRQPRPSEAPPFVAPANEIERRLAALWERVLLIAPIGRDDDFLALGGSSIAGLQLAHAAAAEGLELSVRQVFEQPVLKDLAQAIASTGPAARAEPPAFQDDDPLDDQEALAAIRAQLNRVSS